MDATVKLTPGTGTCQHITAEITIAGETRRIVAMRDDWLKETDDTEKAFETAKANLITCLRIEKEAAITAILAKEPAAKEPEKSLDWVTLSATVATKTFKV